MMSKWFAGCSRATICLFVLASLVISLSGCNRGTCGETADEVEIRHIQVYRTNMQQMQDDLDGIFMLKEPSRLTEMYVR